MITIHKHLKYAIFFAIGFFIAYTTHAQASFLDGENVNVTPNRYYSVFLSSENSGSIYDFYYSEYNGHAIADVNSITGNADTTWIETSQGYCRRTKNDCLNNIMADNAYLVSVDYLHPVTTTHIGFVNTNDYTTDQMLANVIEGTKNTTKKTLPLLVFLGIPLAFALLAFLIFLINKTLTPTKEERGAKRGKTVINPSGMDIIYHNKEDLELKRNYGTRKH